MIENPSRESTRSAIEQKRALQINFSKAERAKEIESHSRPVLNRISSTLQNYKWSLLVSIALLVIIGIVNAVDPNAVKDLAPKWQAYITIFLTTIGLALMLDDKPPEWVRICVMNHFRLLLTS